MSSITFMLKCRSDWNEEDRPTRPTAAQRRSASVPRNDNTHQCRREAQELAAALNRPKSEILAEAIRAYARRHPGIKHK